MRAALLGRSWPPGAPAGVVRPEEALAGLLVPRRDRGRRGEGGGVVVVEGGGGGGGGGGREDPLQQSAANGDDEEEALEHLPLHRKICRTPFWQGCQIDKEGKKRPDSKSDNVPKKLSKCPISGSY